MHTSDEWAFSPRRCTGRRWSGYGPGDRDPWPHSIGPFDPDTVLPVVDDEETGDDDTVPSWPPRRAVPVWDGGPVDDLDEDTQQQETP